MRIKPEITIFVDRHCNVLSPSSLSLSARVEAATTNKNENSRRRCDIGRHARVRTEIIGVWGRAPLATAKREGCSLAPLYSQLKSQPTNKQTKINDRGRWILKSLEPRVGREFLLVSRQVFVLKNDLNWQKL